MLITESSVLRRQGLLRVRREDIEFFQRSPDVLTIEVAVQNVGIEPSLNTTLHIESAPLGAFVPWSPLAEVPVPSIAPGGEIRVRTEVVRPRLKPVGDFFDLPPTRLLTALGFTEPPRRRQSPVVAVTGELSQDVMELLGQRNTHWLGNLNIHCGGIAVERHVARALRIIPGRPNLALMLVGPGQYQLKVEAQPANLPSAVLAWPQDRPFRRAFERSHDVLDCGDQIICGPDLLTVIVDPPKSAGKSYVNVRVTRIPDRREALVEFTLDPAARGPGCFTL